MKESNSRDRDNENQQNFHGDERKVKYTFWCYFEVISSKQCLRLGPFIIIMQKAWFEIYFRFIRNQTYRIFYSCIFDVQYTIVLDTGVSFSTSNLIRIEFKFS